MTHRNRHFGNPPLMQSQPRRRDWPRSDRWPRSYRGYPLIIPVAIWGAALVIAPAATWIMLQLLVTAGQFSPDQIPLIFTLAAPVAVVTMGLGIQRP